MQTILVFTSILLYYIIIFKSDQLVSKRKYLLYMGGILILVSGLRHKYTSPDTIRYVESIEDGSDDTLGYIISHFLEGYLDTSQRDFADPGYLMFENIFGFFSNNQVVFLTTIAAIVIIPLFILLFKATDNKKQLLLPIVFYVCMMFNNIPGQVIRQSIAFALGCIAYMCLQKGGLKYFVILILIASTFHKSSLFIFVFYLAYRFLNAKYLTILTILVFVISIISPSYFISFLGSSDSVYYNYILSSYYDGQEKPFIVLLLMGGLFSIVFYGMTKGWIDLDKNRMEIVGSCFSISLTPLILIDPSMFRLVFYFSIWLALSVAIVLEKMPRGSIIYWALILVLIIKSFSAPMYRFFWQYMPNIYQG